MENKQTAVEWFATKDTELTISFLEGNLSQIELAIEKLKCLQQAKAMEKKQIIDAYAQGIADEAGEIIDATKDAEQYYNETYE